MCHVCDMKKSLAHKNLEFNKVSALIAAAIQKFHAACLASNMEEQAIARKEHQVLTNQFFDLHAEIVALTNQINEATIEVLFSEDIDRVLN